MPPGRYLFSCRSNVRLARSWNFADQQGNGIHGYQSFRELLYDHGWEMGNSGAVRMLRPGPSPDQLGGELTLLGLAVRTKFHVELFFQFHALIRSNKKIGAPGLNACTGRKTVHVVPRYQRAFGYVLKHSIVDVPGDRACLRSNLGLRRPTCPVG